MPNFAAHAAAYGASNDSGVPCAVHGTGTRDNNGSAPCPHGDCPFCPGCAPLHAAVGILPPEMSRADYAPPFAKLAPPPLRLGVAERFALVAGQPRAPPIILI